MNGGRWQATEICCPQERNKRISRLHVAGMEDIHHPDSSFLGCSRNSANSPQKTLEKSTCKPRSRHRFTYKSLPSSCEQHGPSGWGRKRRKMQDPQTESFNYQLGGRRKSRPEGKNHSHRHTNKSNIGKFKYHEMITTCKQSILLLFFCAKFYWLALVSLCTLGRLCMPDGSLS